MLKAIAFTIVCIWCITIL